MSLDEACDDPGFTHSKPRSLLCIVMVMRIWTKVFFATEGQGLGHLLA
jgi:hypothetical protein